MSHKVKRVSRSVGGIRLNLEFKPSVRRRIEMLQKQTEADSFTDVLKKSLVLYEYVWNIKQAGGQLLVKDLEGVRELVLL